MTINETAHPTIATHDEWLAKRMELLDEEKELTKQQDRIAAKRRRLPMERIEKEYRFQTPEGEKTLRELFGEQVQLIVYHFMFDPAWDKGCPGCTGFVDAIGDLSMLGERNTRFVLVSRAPLPKLEAYKAEKGWDVPWFSSFGSEFNYDYHVSLDEGSPNGKYNYRPNSKPGEGPGLSVFFRVGDDVFHTYSTYARGVERLTDSYDLLDVTPYGRQEDWEDSPAGWPQKPTYG